MNTTQAQITDDINTLYDMTWRMREDINQLIEQSDTDDSCEHQAHKLESIHKQINTALGDLIDYERQFTKP